MSGRVNNLKSPIKASLLTSTSHWALTLPWLIDMEARGRKSEEYNRYRLEAEKMLLWQTLRGRPFQPVFRATHFIKPDNWNEPLKLDPEIFS